MNEKSQRPPEQVEVTKLQFVGEQDGVPERELKAKLSELFRRCCSVRRAYLAQVSYGEGITEVALCLRADFDSRGDTVERVAGIFSDIFGSHEHLDILFLNQEQEAALSDCCRTFFSAGGPSLQAK